MALYDNQETWGADGNIGKFVAAAMPASDFKRVQALMKNGSMPAPQATGPSLDPLAGILRPCPVDPYIAQDIKFRYHSHVTGTPTFVVTYKSRHFSMPANAFLARPQAVLRYPFATIAVEEQNGDCIALHALRSGERLLDGALQRGEASGDVAAEMHAQRAAVAIRENLKIAARLRRFHHAECVFLARNRKIRSIVAGDLQEHAGIWSALVCLPCRMQKPRAEAEARGDMLLLAHRVADGLQLRLVRAIHLDVAQHRKIIAGAESAKDARAGSRRETCRRQSPALARRHSCHQ